MPHLGHPDVRLRVGRVVARVVHGRGGLAAPRPGQSAAPEIVQLVHQFKNIELLIN